MAAQIRPNRLEVNDRFPMLGFTIRTQGAAQRAEVAIATSPALFHVEHKAQRTGSNFYSTRAVGPLAVPRGEAVYVVPPEILARFIGQERLYVGLATAPDGNGGPVKVDVMPGDGSPYILLTGLTDRSLRRVRMLPTRQQQANGYGNNVAATLVWAGDTATAETSKANGNGKGADGNDRQAAPATAAAPSDIGYDDGFGPLAPTPVPAAPAATNKASGSTANKTTGEQGSNINGGGGAPAPSAPGSAAISKALDLSDLAITSDLQPAPAPTVTRLPAWQAGLAQAALAAFGGPLAPMIAGLPLAARAANVTIGLGPSVGAGLGGGLGLGVGVLFGPDGGIGVYGAAEFQVGFLASVSATAQVTVVGGTIESFNGWGMAASISGGEGIVGGASALFDSSGRFQGVSVQMGVGAGLTPVDFYVAVQRQVATQLSYAAGVVRQPRAQVVTLSAEIPLDPGNGGMSIGVEPLEVGDIILSTTPAALSGVIRFGSGSDVSHAMLYVGQGEQIIDSTDEGVRLRPLGDALSDANVAVAFRCPGLTDSQKHIIADKAAEFIGLPYNYWGVVRQAVFQVHRSVCDLLPENVAAACRNFYGRVDLGRGSSTEFFCSELIVAAFQAAGVPLTSTPPIWSSPDDLAELAISHGALAYVGHLKAPPYQRRAAIWDSLGLALSSNNGPGRVRPSYPSAAPRRPTATPIRTLSNESFSVNWDEVEAIPQPTSVSCWAAAGAMVVGWNERVSLAPDSLATICSRTTATGLDPAQVGTFAAEIGLVTEPPQSYSLDGFRRLLENSGPLWVAADVPGLHAIVVTGMYVDGDHAFVRVTDPWDRTVGTPGAPGAYLTTHATGSRYILSWDAFVSEYQAAATNFPSVNLQILHAADTGGRSPNYGSAESAGYAQSLRAARALASAQGSRYTRAYGNDSVNDATKARRRDSGSTGAVRWALDQYQGMRMPHMAAAGTPVPPVERTVRLDDWPLVQGDNGDIQLPLTLAWRSEAGAVGDIAIRPGEARSGNGWTLEVTGTVTDGPDSESVTAAGVSLRHIFRRTGRPDIVGLTQLTLFGDGTYQRKDRWEHADVAVA